LGTGLRKIALNLYTNHYTAVSVNLQRMERHPTTGFLNLLKVGRRLAAMSHHLI